MKYFFMAGVAIFLIDALFFNRPRFRNLRNAYRVIRAKPTKKYYSVDLDEFQ